VKAPTGSREMCKGRVTGQAGPVEYLGKPGAPQAHLERSVGDGRKPNQLNHTGHLQCSSYTQESLPMG